LVVELCNISGIDKPFAIERRTLADFGRYQGKAAVRAAADYGASFMTS
jgi:hypothetical protein